MPRVDDDLRRADEFPRRNEDVTKVTAALEASSLIALWLASISSFTDIGLLLTSGGGFWVALVAGNAEGFTRGELGFALSD
jgi:hypothetical protein